jgi:hypothetical protein
VKNRLAALALKAPVIPPIIVEPEPEKYHGDDNAIDDNGRGKIHQRIG